MVIADSCWSVCRRIDMMKHFAINTEITMHCHRLPESDWLRLDGTTVTSPGGTAVSHAAMGDRRDECAYPGASTKASDGDTRRCASPVTYCPSPGARIRD